MKRDFSRLKEGQFDLLICGGGIYGAWSAYDAALRGLKVAIVEQGDWAGATSSASSKLIHGGLRYLESYDFKLVKKALRERQLLLRIAPHRVWPLRFGVPVYKESRVGRLQLKLGLMIYDFLAANSLRLAGPLRKFAHHYFKRQAFARRFPALDTTGLKGGFTYSDAQTDDARLVLELIAGAVAAGAVCVNYCRLNSVTEQEGQVTGATVQNMLDDTFTEVMAQQLVYATGQWSAAAEMSRSWCRVTKGIHMVMPAVLAEEALLLTAAADGRVFFMIPWYGLTLVGTTDTDYRGDMERVEPDESDVAYLLDAANHYLKTSWTTADVISSYAGLRVMKCSDKSSPSAVSRDWELKTGSNGVHYSIGGKITSAREDAACIVDRVCAELGREAPCASRERLLPWAPDEDYAAWFAALSAKAVRLHVDEESAKWLLRRHGKRANEILADIENFPALAQRITPGVPLIFADLIFCARNEMVVHLDDLLRRRMPLIILNKFTMPELGRLAFEVSTELGWDDSMMKRELASCSKYAAA
ncbi:MAG: FAD-dependent oxidoreductase [Gallionellales bacterium 35-53-114]|jgi:glycerol-3-phosphate dehydrogenase|nr:MAG: FAD-dependent oxidoreductase [Gallionellales bacterium 35-53-114]OYZ65265.1 MAG: FAD-dependent oxidoreductase [Gallionellales bacterium 24-53-125]OZB08171.1 MAG: FAD-dependent oxidoreductase [Gallionellales bacterium 39-52-133]HQS58098.1 glycerol-3-phosphate dehydrogenase/oxidase [Gallionellaceae bacterium]HQS73653.1 glycerol-3-phosphate dehydrogenase/oxidase [Gallionellaceae bacterium]